MDIKYKTMTEHRFLDIKGMTDYIHLSKSTIYKMVSTDRIPHIKIGSRTLFDKEQIDKWVLCRGFMPHELPQLPKL
jgi:excisionase family DNA binding protein